MSEDTTMPDADALPAIRARLEAVPPRLVMLTGQGWPLDWVELGFGDGKTGIVWPIADWRTLSLEPAAWLAVARSHEMQAFIATAPTDLALLLAAVDQLRAGERTAPGSVEQL